jgi:hypothetical protein
MSSKKRSKEEAQQALENRILKGLSCEWDAAISVLNSKQHISFKKPLFKIKSMKRRLGYWSGDKNEICQDRHFVLNHPWDSIREVLYHEMAHQFTDQVYRTYNESPHGPMFKKACHLLRANPKASGNYKSLRERLLTDTIKTEDKIMLRIKKLMALSESTNQYEAEAAMSKTHELISKYNIRLLEQHTNRNFESIFIGSPRLRHRREEYFIANLLQDFYFIQGIWVSAYVIDKNKMGHVLEISGTLQNLRIASYVHDFIIQYIHSRWIDYNNDNLLNCYRKSDFAVGVIEGFRSKLESEQKRKKDATDSAYPVKIEDSLLVSYFSHRYPYVRNSKIQSPGPNEVIFNDGKEIGKKMVIHKGIHEKVKKKRLFLP